MEETKKHKMSFSTKFPDNIDPASVIGTTVKHDGEDVCTVSAVSDETMDGTRIVTVDMNSKELMDQAIAFAGASHHVKS